MTVNYINVTKITQIFHVTAAGGCLDTIQFLSFSQIMTVMKGLNQIAHEP
jgi:hypothetical protein